MAQDTNDDVEIVEGIEDTAKSLTTGLIIATTVTLLLALIVMQVALGKWFLIGPFKP